MNAPGFFGDVCRAAIREQIILASRMARELEHDGKVGSKEHDDAVRFVDHWRARLEAVRAAAERN